VTPPVSSKNGPVADLTVGPPPAPSVRPRDPADVPGPPDGALAEELVPQVDESVVRMSLQAFGGLLSYPLADDDVVDHWRFTERELDDLTPPLTRIVNRNAKLRRAVIRGDEMAVAVAFGGYVGRNMTEGHKARKVRRERDGEAEVAEGDVRAAGPGMAPGGSREWPGSGDGRGHDDAAGGGVDR
jgi:hypothetical protein